MQLVNILHTFTIINSKTMIRDKYIIVKSLSYIREHIVHINPGVAVMRATHPGAYTSGRGRNEGYASGRV